VETVYHRRTHSETGQTPLRRWSAADPPSLPSPAQLREAFLWSEHRTVTKTATVSLHGNLYEVDAALVGRRVELLFDPFDLTAIEVRWHGRPMGAAVPHKIGRHVHHKARPELDTGTPAPATGIDYLRLVEHQHSTELADRLRYAQLVDPTAADTTTGGDSQLEAELAEFAALLQPRPDTTGEDAPGGQEPA
jgi:putative transposase